MKKIYCSIIVIIMLSLSITPLNAYAGKDRTTNSEKRQDRRTDTKKDYRKKQVKSNHNYSGKRHYGKKVVVVTPRHRSYRNVVIIRPHGHAYIGYGGFYNDNDAWKWLAFTAITLKVLDNINEEAQREHEAAQIEATTAPVGEKITWQNESSSGFVVTTKEGKDTSGSTCREFQQQITVSGKTEQAYGTACLQADGAWKIVS